MVLGTIAEHSLPLSLAPVLVQLSQALAEDKAALNAMQLSRTSASYKMRYGMGLTIAERIFEHMRKLPYSVNIDEATSDTNKKVLAVLVCYYNMEKKTVDVEHLTSLELYKTNAATIYNALTSFFSKNKLPLKNMVSMLLDSCAVMRGSKEGLETKIRKKDNPNMLDVDGDSCHHIHNSSRVFCKQFDGWLESLFKDVAEDHRWATDQKSYLEQICEIIGIPYTQPPRFLDHRWLSAYDAAMSLDRMMPAYQILYFGFLRADDKAVYQDVIDKLYDTYKVNEKAKRKITYFHHDLVKKSMTDKGKARKKRVVEKLFFQYPTTQMQLSVYESVLPIMKSYVMVFQGKSTLVHKLHDQQLQVFSTFLGCFVKPEYFNDKTPAELTNLDVTKPTIHLSNSQVYMGAKARSVVQKLDGKVVSHFMEQLKSAYQKCAAYMQKTLPLNSPTLKAFSAIDPAARGHSVTQKYLEVLAKKLKHTIPEENNISLEIVKYNTDREVFQSTQTLRQMWLNGGAKL